MAVTVINVPLLVLNTLDADNGDAGNGTNTLNGIVATSAADGWDLTPPTGVEFANDRLILRMSVTTASTYVIAAGTRYPAQRADLGSLSLTMATNDSRMIVIETSRFLKTTGLIHVSSTNQATDTLSGFMLPRGA